MFDAGVVPHVVMNGKRNMNAEEKILEDRLLNWGRWNQDPKRQGRSPLCAFMEAVPDDEKDNDVPVERHDGPPPVDVSDALLVQRAWERLPVAPERYRKARMVVGVAYAYHVPFRDLKRILRKYHRINLHEREFDGLVEMGRKMIRNNLLKLEGMPPK
mgnify:CR=1 FL=1